MSYLTRFWCIAFSGIFSCAVFAVDLPDVDEGVQELDQSECVNENYQKCLDDVCTTSDDIDCNSNCQKMSQDQCEQQSDD